MDQRGKNGQGKRHRQSSPEDSVISNPAKVFETLNQKSIDKSISRAKHALSNAEGTQRRQEKKFRYSDFGFVSLVGVITLRRAARRIIESL